MRFNHSEQAEAIGIALLLIQRLPVNTIWALTVTEDPGDSTLNIWADEHDWLHLACSMRLAAPVDRDKGFITYEQGPLTISIISEEEEV